MRHGSPTGGPTKYSGLSSPLCGIATGAERRLRQATETRIRAKHQPALAAATDRRQKTAIEDKIQQELREEMARIASPHSLWHAT